MAYYRTCPTCGSHLDFGEICDCRYEKQNEAAPLQRERPQARTPRPSVAANSGKVKARGTRVWLKS